MWATIIAALIALAGTAYGAYQNRKDTEAAKTEAQRLDARDFAVSQSNNRFNRQMQQQKLAQNQEEINLNRFQTGYGIQQDQIKRIEGLLNSHVGLQQALLNNWKMGA